MLLVHTHFGQNKLRKMFLFRNIFFVVCLCSFALGQEMNAVCKIAQSGYLNGELHRRNLDCVNSSVRVADLAKCQFGVSGVNVVACNVFNGDFKLKVNSKKIKISGPNLDTSDCALMVKVYCLEAAMIGKNVRKQHVISHYENENEYLHNEAQLKEKVSKRSEVQSNDEANLAKEPKKQQQQDSNENYPQDDSVDQQNANLEDYVSQTKRKREKYGDGESNDASNSHAVENQNFEEYLTANENKVQQNSDFDQDSNSLQSESGKLKTSFRAQKYFVESRKSKRNADFLYDPDRNRAQYVVMKARHDEARAQHRVNKAEHRVERRQKHAKHVLQNPHKSLRHYKRAEKKVHIAQKLVPKAHRNAEKAHKVVVKAEQNVNKAHSNKNANDELTNEVLVDYEV